MDKVQQMDYWVEQIRLMKEEAMVLRARNKELEAKRDELIVALILRGIEPELEKK